MSVLITGVAGFIGSHLAERLVGSGVSVVGTDGFATYYDPAVKRRNLEACCRAPSASGSSRATSASSSWRISSPESTSSITSRASQGSGEAGDESSRSN